MCEVVPMIVWNIFRKLILIPVIMALTLIEWAGAFLAGMVNTAINLVAILLIAIAVLLVAMEVTSGMECLRMVALATGAVIVSNLLVCVVSVIGAIRRILMEHL